MTDKRYTAVLATLFDSASDATPDYAVSRHNIHKMVFLLSLIAGIGQAAIGFLGALLSLFVFAIALLYINCIKNENASIKEVKTIGIILALGTMFLYVAALPYFAYLALKGKGGDKPAYQVLAFLPYFYEKILYKTENVCPSENLEFGYFL